MNHYLSYLLSFTSAFAAVNLPAVAAYGEAPMMKPLRLSDIKVGGEIGRRLDITINNNLLALDVELSLIHISEPTRPY